MVDREDHRHPVSAVIGDALEGVEQVAVVVGHVVLPVRGEVADAGAVGEIEVRQLGVEDLRRAGHGEEGQRAIHFSRSRGEHTLQRADLEGGGLLGSEGVRGGEVRQREDAHERVKEGVAERVAAVIDAPVCGEDVLRSAHRVIHLGGHELNAR